MKRLFTATSLACAALLLSACPDSKVPHPKAAPVQRDTGAHHPATMAASPRANGLLHNSDSPSGRSQGRPFENPHRA